MLFGQHRVEEDLERIRRANLPPEQLAQENAKAERDKKKYAEAVEGVTLKDYFAMIIAALSIVLPYAAVIIGACLFVLLLLKTIYL